MTSETSRSDYHSKLLEIAPTELQKRWVEAWIRNDESSNKAAAELGADSGSFRRVIRRCRLKLTQQGLSPDHDLIHEIPEGMRNRGQSIKYDADGNIVDYWNKSAIQGREADDPSVVQIPGRRVVKTATNYDEQGRVRTQWVTEKPEEKAREESWIQFAKELAQEMPRASPIEAPTLTNSNLLNVVPISDGHIGMLAWGKENPEGKDWDLKIGESMHMKAFDYLFDSAPRSDVSLLAILGDWFHYDSWKPVTPEHQNLLDADSRAPKMIRVGMRIVRYGIDRALEHHRIVHVIAEIGNHDPYSALFLMEALQAIYENEPRVIIDTSPQHFHYLRFGKVLIGTHHGHGVKADKLPLIMASARPEDWGQTKHRVWHTGHVHHDYIEEFNGCKVEKHRILAPADSYAAQHGYVSGRSMKTIVYHREHGEVVRLTVGPEMLDM